MMRDRAREMYDCGDCFRWGVKFVVVEPERGGGGEETDLRLECVCVCSIFRHPARLSLRKFSQRLL